MRARCSILIGFMLVATLAVTGEVDAQTVSDAVKQDVSQPLSSIPPPLPRAQAAFKKIHRVKRIPAPPALQAAGADTALQPKAAASLPIGPIEVIEGIGEGMLVNGQPYQVTSFPADTTGAVGSTQYVQWVNTSMIVFDKTTKQPVLGPVDGLPRLVRCPRP